MATTTQVVKGAVRRGEQDLLASLALLPGSQSDRLKACLSRRCTPWPPWAYLGYYRLGSWLLNGCMQQADEIDELIDDVCRAIELSPIGLHLLSFSDSGHVSPRLWCSFLDLFQEGGDFVDDLEPPLPHELEHWQGAISQARPLIAQADPDFAEMMLELQSLLVLTRPGLQARKLGQAFGGATCFFFRGASVINSTLLLSTLVTLNLLVHEYAHAELFVLGQEQPLCLNHDDERHSVLIRKDPRPMNGILHSLHVVSRVAAVLQRLLHDDPTAEAREQLHEQLRLGRSSLQVVERHAQLTPLGETIVAGARQRLVEAATAAAVS